MSWNYRLVRQKVTTSDAVEHDYIGIYEVYYDVEGKPNRLTAEPIAIVADTAEECREDYDAMADAFGRPVLVYPEDFKT